MKPDDDARAQRIALAFAQRLLEDEAGGQLGSLSEYLALFPEHEAIIAREYLRFREERDPHGETGESTAARVGPYEIVRVIGQGGQGAVYEALDTRLDRRVALKVLSGRGPALEDRIRRFRREAEIAGRLKHPGICPVLDSGMSNGVAHFAMPLLEGETLAELLDAARNPASDLRPVDGDFHDALDRQRDPPRPPTKPAPGSEPIPQSKIDWETCVVWFSKIARALHAAHEVGIVHRDIKPANLFILRNNEPIIVDFGLARDDEDSFVLTATGDLLGTPAYMAPEQITPQHHTIDRRTDVYALAVSLFEAVTLRRPFDGPTREVLYQQILTTDAPSSRALNPSLPRDLDLVIRVALDKDPNRRFTSALAFAEDLERVRTGEPVSARAPSVSTHLLRWVRRRPGTAASLASIFLLLLAGVGFFYAYWRNAESHRQQLGEEVARRDILQADLQSSLEERNQALTRAQALRLQSLALTQIESEPHQAARYLMEAARRCDDPAIGQTLVEALGRIQRPPVRVLPDTLPWVSFTPEGTVVSLRSGSPLQLVLGDPDPKKPERSIKLRGLNPEFAVLSPDGRFAAVSHDEGIDVIDIAAGTVAHEVTVTAEHLAWSPHSDAVISVHDVDGTATVGRLHLATGKTETFAIPEIPRPRWAAVSSGGQILVVGQGGQVGRWDLRGVLDFEYHVEVACPFPSIGFGPEGDGFWITTRSGVDYVRFDGSPTRPLIPDLRGRSNGLWVATDQSPSCLVTGPAVKGSIQHSVTSPGRAMLLPLDPSLPAQVLVDGSATWVAQSLDGQRVAVVVEGRKARVLHRVGDTFEFLTELTFQADDIRALAFDPTGQLLAVEQGDAVRVHPVGCSEIVPTAHGRIDAAIPFGKEQIAVLDRAVGLRFLNGLTLETEHVVALPKPSFTASSTNSTPLGAWGDGFPLVADLGDGSISWISPTEQRPAGRLAPGLFGNARVGVAAGGERIVASLTGGGVAIYAPGSGTVARVKAHAGTQWDISPDGHWIAMIYPSSANSPMALFSVEDGSVGRAFDGFVGQPMSARFSPDGESIATWSATRSMFSERPAPDPIEVWNSRTGARIALLGPMGSRVIDVAWHPRDATLVAAHAGGELTTWDLASGKQLGAMRCVGPVDTVQLSRDGTKIAATGSAGIAQVFDWATGQEVLRVSAPKAGDGSSQRFDRLIWVCSDSGLVTLDSGRTLRRWPLDPLEWAAQAGLEELSEAERKMLGL